MDMRVALCAIFVLVLAGEQTVTGVQNFAETKDHVEFIYHGEHSLLLAIKQNYCFFMHFPDDCTAYLTNDYYRNLLQGELVSVFRHAGSRPRYTSRGGTVVTASSLPAVRDKFTDRLADFHCLDKTIREVRLSDNFFRYLLSIVDNQAASASSIR